MKVWIHPQPSARVMVSDNAAAPSVGNVGRDQIQGGSNVPRHIGGVPNGGPQHIEGVPKGSDQHIQCVQEAFVLSTLAATGLTS